MPRRIAAGIASSCILVSFGLSVTCWNPAAVGTDLHEISAAHGGAHGVMGAGRGCRRRRRGLADVAYAASSTPNGPQRKGKARLAGVGSGRAALETGLGGAALAVGSRGRGLLATRAPASERDAAKRGDPGVKDERRCGDAPVFCVLTHVLARV